jgi:hypothetical protein
MYCPLAVNLPPVSKKLDQKQQRRQAEERRKTEERRAALRRNGITIAVALIVAGVVIYAIMQERDSGSTPTNVGGSVADANCGEIETFDEQEADHIDVGETHEPYNSSPPTSGPHYEVPAETTFFTEQLPPEQLVHNLEHGQIVFWYLPDADTEALQNLEDVVAQEPLASAAAPYTDIESPYQFVMTAWGASQACENVSQEVVDDFRREYQGKGPELIAPPFDG